MTSFSSLTNLSTQVDMGVLAGTSACATFYRNNLYLFYVGDGGDGIWFTDYDNSTWANPVTHVQAAGLNMWQNTSPSTAVLNNANTLYLFYSGSGGTGLWYTSTSNNAQSWAPVQPVQPPTGPMKNTSPSSVGFSPGGQEAIYLFYNGNGNDGIYSMSSANGTSWTSPQLVGGGNIGMSVMQGTSPNAVVLGNTLYLFFTGGGGGGIFYTTSENGVTWSEVASVGSSLQGGTMQVEQRTSPSAVVIGSQLYLFWTDVNGDGLWSTSFDATSQTWSSAAAMSQQFPGGQPFVNGTSACAAVYNNEGYVFWVAPGIGQDINRLVIDYANWTPATS